MKTKSWTEFIEKIYKRILDLRDENCDVPFFRGQTNKTNYYKLIPKIYRDPFKTIFENKTFFEYDLYFDFVTQAGSRIEKENTWENLFLMQDYGLPTRLLDWTNNFAIALFFALKDYDVNQKYCPEIIILNPFKLNKTSYPIGEQTIDPIGELINPELTREFPRYIDLVDIDITKNETAKYRKEFPIAFYPYRFNDRLIAQSGYFTFHGSNQKGIDELVPSSITKFEVTPSIVPEAIRFLDLAGINEHSIFTDLDSLSTSLSNHFQTKYYKAQPSGSHAIRGKSGKKG